MWFVYWHKFANSGLWRYKEKNYAYEAARDLLKQEEVSRIIVLESNCWEEMKE